MGEPDKQIGVATQVTSMALPLAAADIECASEKERKMFESLGKVPSLLVAFSGGADSAYLAWAASHTLNTRALAVTAISPSYSEHDRGIAETFVRNHGVRHEWLSTDEMSNPLYVANNPDRCYFCKDELFARMEELARERGFAAIAYGVNTDDTRDFRPGHRAAREHAILAPMLDAGLTKTEIRLLSRRAGLETWDRPASACLSSRIPYGSAVSAELLRQIERAENAVRSLGFRQFRVRAHDDLGRVEIDRPELPRALEATMSRRISEVVREAGFDRVEIDPSGYRQGSLNDVLRVESVARRVTAGIREPDPHNKDLGG
jgi:pyridinium-3,5-biscarboxylic acid mononucleotide sulfurtransferase